MIFSDEFLYEMAKGMQERKEKLDRLQKLVAEKRDKLNDTQLEKLLEFYENLR
jgi:hypothetical protein